MSSFKCASVSVEPTSLIKSYQHMNQIIEIDCGISTKFLFHHQQALPFLRFSWLCNYWLNTMVFNFLCLLGRSKSIGLNSGNPWTILRKQIHSITCIKFVVNSSIPQFMRNTYSSHLYLSSLPIKHTPQLPLIKSWSFLFNSLTNCYSSVSNSSWIVTFALGWREWWKGSVFYFFISLFFLDESVRFVFLSSLSLSLSLPLSLWYWTSSLRPRYSPRFISVPFNQ